MGSHVAEKHGKTGRKKTIGIIVISLLFLTAAVAAGFVLHWLNLINYAEDTPEPIQSPLLSEEKENMLSDDVKSEKILEYENYVEENLETVYDVEYEFYDDVFNILLIGLDNRESGQTGTGRTDSMMILSVNRKTERIIATSVLRDTYVSIPGCCYEKLNAAYVLGGPELLFETVGANFKIDLCNYVVVDFFTFMDAIDAVGGVELELTPMDTWCVNAFIEEESEWKGISPEGEFLPAETEGLVHLDGVQALCYARNRLLGSDLERTERQRKVIGALLKGAQDLSLKELNSLAEVLLPGITTNMEKKDILALVSHAPEYLKYDFVSMRIPDNSYMSFETIGGASVVCADFQANRKLWADAVYGE